MKKTQLLFLTMAIFAFSFSAGAYDFNAADGLFKQRENNLTAISQARSLYEQALNNSRDKNDQLYAVDQLGKLAYYEGELLTAEDNHARRVEIFTQCMDYVDRITPDKVGETGAYYYWKTACMALWGKSASKLSVLWRLSELKDAMRRGLEFDPNFGEGGMHRVVATIQIRSKAMSWLPGGLYDPNAALQHIDQAIAIGPQYYNIYLIKAEILQALGRNDEALSLLETTKRDLEVKIRTNRLPAGLEPESKVFLKQIRNALRG